MRTVIVNLFSSLDGFATSYNEDVSWITNNLGDEQAQYGLDQHLAIDTLVLGRVTYQIMAAYWPSTAGNGKKEQWRSSGEEWSFADRLTDRMNSIPKIVFSRTLNDEDITWNNARLNKGNPAEEIAKLKRQADGDIGIRGSVSLVNSLIKAGMVDRLRLEVLPVMLGAYGGKPIFEGYDRTDLELIGAATLDSSVAVLDYQPAVSSGA